MADDAVRLQKRRNRALLLLVVLLCLSLAVCYLVAGAIYSLASLYSYNVRNWEVFGGVSLPPLFFPGVLFDLLLWPWYLRADWHNGVGVFGECG